MRHNLNTIKHILERTTLWQYILNHATITTSHSRISSLPQRKNPVCEESSPLLFPTPPSPRQPLIYFMSLDSPILDIFQKWNYFYEIQSFVTGFPHLDSCFQDLDFMLSRFISVVVCVTNCLPFYDQIIFHCTDILHCALFLHSSMWTLGLFPFLVIMSVTCMHHPQYFQGRVKVPVPPHPYHCLLVSIFLISAIPVDVKRDDLHFSAG